MAGDPKWVEKRFFPAFRERHAFTDYSSAELAAAFEDADEDGNDAADDAIRESSFTGTN